MKFSKLILFEDGDLLVIKKPPNLVVNKAETQKDKTLQDYIETYLGIETSEIGIGGRAGIIHRLDKETSGLLVVAKTQKAFDKLQSQFKKRQVKKRYIGLVHGKISTHAGIIDAPLGRNPRNRTKFAVVEGGRMAVTQFSVLNYYLRGEEEYFSLLELHPITGRTHQIRVHLTAFGHPIVSDPLYVGRKRSKSDRHWCPRLFLHAGGLQFMNPRTGKNMTFKIELADDLRGALKKLKLVM